MEEYEKEIFDFFTQEDNFRNMCKVAKHSPTIKDQLLEDFWKLVQSSLTEVIQNRKSDYKIKITGPIKDKRTKIILFKDIWPHENNQPIVAIAIQRLAENNWPFFGPWINTESKIKNLQEIYAYAQNTRISTSYEKDDDKSAPFYKSVDIDFINDEEYIKILPINRNEFAISIAEDVFGLAKDFEIDLEEMIKIVKFN